MSQGNNSGWIKYYRKTKECWIWDNDEPFDKRSAWADLLLSANHSDKNILFDGSLITISRGQYMTSIRKLSSTWKWSTTKVKHFLELLENDSMITKKSDSKKTLITIVNYEVYQGDTTDKNTLKSQSSDTEVTQKILNKNNNNDKNDKNIRKDIPKGISKRKIFIPPTIDEIAEYCRERNNHVSPEKFFDFYESKGWMVGKNKMKDWKAAVRTWENHDKNERGNNNGEHNTTQLTEEELRERGFFDLV